MKIKTMIFATLAFAVVGITANAGDYKMFWLTSTITRDTIGPIVKKPGTKFTAGGKEWTVLASRPNEILFADSATSRHHGPYDFVLDRIVDLGGFAMAISRIEEFEGDESTPPPPIIMSRAGDPAPTAPDVARPQRWDPKPLPSTNPGAHKTVFGDLAVIPRRYPAAGILWIEPVRTVKYDWSVGDYTGGGGEDMEMTRLGVSATWRNWFAEIYASTDVKTSGGIVPDRTYLSGLELDSGSGLGGRAGCVYSFVIDGNWNANIGAMASYETTTMDMNAIVFQKSGEYIVPEVPATPEASGTESSTVYEYTFADYSEEVDMEESAFSLIGGIDYTSMYWGVGAYLLVDIYTDVSYSGSLDIGDQHYNLNAERTDPVGILFSGWYSPYADYIVGGGVSFGTETSLRIGAGKFF